MLTSETGVRDQSPAETATTGGSKRDRGRPRQQETDAKILHVTLTLLAQRGYARTSLDAVAQEAGVSKPTIYLRYASKAALARAALEWLAHQRDETAPAETGDLRTDLIAQVRHFQRGVSRPYGVTLIAAVLTEEYETPELLALYREQIVTPRRAMIRLVLEHAQERGQLRRSSDLDLLVNMLVGTFYAQYLEGRPLDEQWAERLVDHVLSSGRP